jgi:hypothetical protein
MSQQIKHTTKETTLLRYDTFSKEWIVDEKFVYPPLDINRGVQPAIQSDKLAQQAKEAAILAKRNEPQINEQPHEYTTLTNDQISFGLLVVSLLILVVMFGHSLMAAINSVLDWLIMSAQKVFNFLVWLVKIFGVLLGLGVSFWIIWELIKAIKNGKGSAEVNVGGQVKDTGAGINVNVNINNGAGRQNSQNNL